MLVCQNSSPSQACLTVVGSRNESCSPRDPMGTRNFGAGKDVVKRGLNGCGVGEETPVEI